jgi:NAD(P)-dependent dehydrogenase (short-subunit alcohol dehydrogenase family)
VGTLSEKVAVVTGGASGIGLAAATRLAAEGANLVIVDLNEEAGKAVAADLGGRFVRADVGRSEDWPAVVADAEESFGGIDLAYLNAGVTTQQPDITAVTDEQVRRVFGANVDGVIFGTRAVVPAIERRGGGAIVATASLAGIIPFAPDPLYTATKHAVVGLVRSLAPQLAAKHITINAVCPGVVDTPLVGAARERLKEAGFPMLAPEEIADAVVQCMTGGAESGECLVCHAGTPPQVHGFGDVPGLGRRG